VVIGKRGQNSWDYIQVGLPKGVWKIKLGERDRYGECGNMRETWLGSDGGDGDDAPIFILIMTITVEKSQALADKS
jgi:hypothetical protein